MRLPSRHLPVVPLVALLLGHVALGCEDDGGGSSGGAFGPADGGVFEGGSGSPDGAAPPPDAGANADAAPEEATYYEPDVPARWTKVTLADVGITQRSMSAAVFDGRYVYLAPAYDFVSSPQSRIARYDTQGDVAQAGSWSSFDPTTLDPGAKSWSSAAFDGRYVHFAPEGKNGPGNVLARYDTQAPFGTGSSWSTFDTKTVDANLVGFAGSAFDGKYLYLAPGSGLANNNLRFARLDTTVPLTGAAFTAIDTSSVTGQSNATFEGAVTLGGYVYFNQRFSASGQVALKGRIWRYDRNGAFSAGTPPWTSFDLTTLVPGTDYAQGITDGKYLYWANGGAGKVVRLDPAKDFTTAAAWTTFDVKSVDSGAANFVRSAFDGRYAWFVALPKRLVRYDTRADFASAAAWKVVDVAATAGVADYGGSGAIAFDGKYLYFAPGRDDAATLLRFEARSAASAFRGSFY